MQRILIVDDSWFQRINIRNLLKQDNYEFLEADNGESAIDLLGKEKVDCVVLDLVMPNVDGFAVLESIRANKLTMPVIVVSADIQETTHEHCRQFGVAAIVNKPLTKASGLAELVTQILQTSLPADVATD